MISHIKIAIAGTISAKFVVIKKRLIPGRLGLGSSSQLIVKLFGVFGGFLTDLRQVHIKSSKSKG